MPRNPMSELMGELFPLMLTPDIDPMWLSQWRASASRRYGPEPARQAYLQVSQVRQQQFPAGAPTPSWEQLVQAMRS